MSTADLDHIRALLVAQTAEAEPQPTGLFGRLFAARASQRRATPPPQPHQRFAVILDLAAPETPKAEHETATVPHSTASGFEPELLLEQIASPMLAIEVASPLPPPAPRAGFGRRPDLSPEPELVLDQPATHVRRLQLLDPNGQPVGEMILQPDKAAITAPSAEVPFFPEDFLDHQEPVSSGEPEPLRPWLKALRNSSLPRPVAPVSESAIAEVVAAEVADTAPLAKRVRQRRVAARRPPAKAAAQPLGHDLLEALAMTLAREHENLADRLLSVAQEAVFIRAFTEPAAA